MEIKRKVDSKQLLEISVHWKMIKVKNHHCRKVVEKSWRLRGQRGVIGAGLGVVPASRVSILQPQTFSPKENIMASWVDTMACGSVYMGQIIWKFNWIESQWKLHIWTSGVPPPSASCFGIMKTIPVAGALTCKCFFYVKLCQKEKPDYPLCPKLLVDSPHNES